MENPAALNGLPDSLAETARSRLGVTYLYPLQRFVVSNTLEGRSQIVVLPTGAGKSLCFQLPALLLPGATLVLLPLLSLMSDQLRKLREAGVPTGVLRGGMSQEEKSELFAGVQSGKISIVLATPEACQVESSLARLRSCRFSHLVMDEAHCISEWGESFRPAYREVGTLARALGIPLRTAFTATASPAVIDRIKEILFEDDDVRVVASAPDRPNIVYGVRQVLSMTHALQEMVRTSPRPVLAFFRTRSSAEVAARALRARLSDDRVRFYHAGLLREERADCERWFLSSPDGVLFATSAYGMGVDKPDIRTVIHAGVPESVEAYLQETGRAGRDGKPSDAVLLVSREDSMSLPEGESARQRYQRILSYALSRGTCRRQALLQLIGAEPVACSGCDVCAGTEAALPQGQQAIRDFIWRFPRRFSAAQAAEALTAAQGPRPTRRFHDCLPGYGALAGWVRQDAEAAIHELVLRGVISLVKRGPWKRTLTRARPARRPPVNPEERS